MLVAVQRRFRLKSPILLSWVLILSETDDDLDVGWAKLLHRPYLRQFDDCGGKNEMIRCRQAQRY